MGRLLLYELKKMVRRPLFIVVALGCIATVIFTNFYAASQIQTTVWGPELYGSYDAIPQNELARAHDGYGLTGPYDGTVIFNGRRALELERQAAEPFTGLWDDARLAEMAAGYGAFLADPANYLHELDAWAMEKRTWALAAQGLSAEEIDAYNAANPIYALKPEIAFGAEGRAWDSVARLLESYVITQDGTARTMAEAFPLVPAPAQYGYHTGPRFATEVQGILVGILGLLLLLAGLSPVFSEEVSCHTEPMLLAAKYGRDRQIRAKLLAGLLFALGSVVALTALNLVCSALAFGAEGWGVPIQLDTSVAMDTSTTAMPFAFTYGQYLLAMFAFEALGLCAMGGVLMLLSAAVRSALPVIFAGGLFSLVVIIFATTGTGLLRALTQILPPGLIVPSPLLYDGANPGLGFLPLLQWAVAVLACMAVAVAAAVYVSRKYKRLRKT